MATMITNDCINCGACEPECPNNAISQGPTVFVIDPKLCTECVGFHDYEACAAVCPVDVCVTDPNNIESEEVLIARAKQLHPEVNFPENFESRFRKGQGKPAPAAAAAGAPSAGVTPASAAAGPVAAGAAGASGPSMAMITPNCAEHGMPRARRIVTITRSFFVSRTRVVSVAIVSQPRPRTIGNTALPFKPIRRKTRCSITASRGR